MKTLLLFCLLFSSLNSADPFQITFIEASPKEASKIQKHLLFFYGKQLLDAGLFEVLDNAIEAATDEWNQEIVDNPSKALYYYHITFAHSSTHYGYLVYSIADRIAFLEAIYLEESYRGQGLGKQILQEFEMELKKKDIETIKLYVFAHNVGAFKLYDQMGYKIETTYADGSKIIGHHMKKNIQDNFSFKLAKQSEKQQIIHWLDQEHIKEWLHGKGLKNLLEGLDNFFTGDSDSQHWIASYQTTPFAYLLTSPADSDAITLDLFICDLNFIGKGLAVPMIQTFLITQFPHMKKVLIDPEMTNTRAIHVYKKVGFKIIGEFIASWHPVPHYQMELYMKDLLNPAV